MTQPMLPDSPFETPVEGDRTDIAVVGAGLAGTTTAILLARAGWRVTLIDTHALHPPEFRAEKMGDVHMAPFDRMGLGEVVRQIVTPIDGGWIYRFGRLVEQNRCEEWGFAYSDLVNGLRRALPSPARFIVGRVAEVKTGPVHQHITLADGSAVTARLIVVATGLGDAVRRAIGIKRRETNKTHSLSLAFNLAKPATEYPFGSLTYYAKDVRSRFAYLTLFPIGDVMRSNFFVYREVGDPWVKAFRRDPQALLREAVPEISGLCGDMAIAGPVEIRPIHLLVTEEYRRDGVVLVGDAFCTTCPVPGVGILRVLTDVERLCTVHAPAWLATPGMDRHKIGTYYDDPVKRAVDSNGIAASLRARAIATDGALLWSARRLRNNLVRRSLYEGRRLWAQIGTAPSQPVRS